MKNLIILLSLLLLSLHSANQEVTYIMKVGSKLSDLMNSGSMKFAYPTKEDIWKPRNSIFIAFDESNVHICLFNKFVNGNPTNEVTLDTRDIKFVNLRSLSLIGGYPIEITITFNNGSVLWINGYYPDESKKIVEELKKLKYHFKYYEESQKEVTGDAIIDKWISDGEILLTKLGELKKCFNVNKCESWIDNLGGRKEASEILESNVEKLFERWRQLDEQKRNIIKVKNLRGYIIKDLELMKYARGY